MATEDLRDAGFLGVGVIFAGGDPCEPVSLDPCAGAEQGFEGGHEVGHEVSLGRAVVEAVTGVFENGAAPLVDFFERRAAIR